MRRIAIALLFVATLSPARALAQAECEEGRVRVDERCCWPGQTFSAERLRCEGEPQCPSALTVHGETCVARATVPIAEPVPTAPATVEAEPVRVDGALALTIPEAYGASTRAWPVHGEDQLFHAARVRGEDETLIGFALAVFDFGFVLGLMGAGFDELVRRSSSWPLALIPVAGAVSSGFARFTPSSSGSSLVFGFVMGIPATLLQLIGVVSAIIAFANSTDEVAIRPIRDAGGLALSIVPSAPGADAGLSLVLSF